MSLRLREEILKQINKKFLPSFTIHEMVTLPITSLDKYQIDRLLGLFKKVLFFYKYDTLPLSNYLTFEIMSTTPDKAFRAFGASTTIDSEKFKNEIKEPSNKFRNNSKLYTNAALESGPGMALGGRGRTRVKRSNKNIRMRTRRSRTRRTRRYWKYYIDK